MHTFTDYYQNEVHFSYKDHPFSERPRHVFVICMYKGDWLLTKHKERGLEFPGGKVEDNETVKQGAIREVWEETGGKVSTLIYIGQYLVKGKKERIIKNVYYAEIDSLIERQDYYETHGPVLLKKIPENLPNNNAYSFLMKDKVLTYSLQKIAKHLRS